jgi:hypothetical protein
LREYGKLDTRFVRIFGEHRFHRTQHQLLAPCNLMLPNRECF